MDDPKERVPGEPVTDEVPVVPPTLADSSDDWDTVDHGPHEETKRRLGVTSALGRILSMYLGHLRLFALLGVPGGVLAAFANLSVRGREDLGLYLVLVVAIIAVNGITGLAIIAAADDLRGGQATSVGSVARRAANRAVPVLVSSAARYLTLGLTYGLVAVVVAVLFLGVGAGSQPVSLGIVGAVAIGLLAVVLIRWCAADAAIVLEGDGPLEALGRSRALTGGNTIRIVALYVLDLAIVLPASIGSGLLGVVIGIPVLTAALTIGASIVTFPILSITGATIFGDLTGRTVATAEIGPRPSRRAGLAAGWIAIGVVGLAISVPRFGAASAKSVLDRVPAADRGHIYAGTIKNPADPCHPLGTKADFSNYETIYIGGYFTQIVPAGQSANVALSINGVVLASVPLASTAGTLGCYYELDPLVGARSGAYRFAVTLGQTSIAEGEFTVR